MKRAIEFYHFFASLPFVDIPVRNCLKYKYMKLGLIFDNLQDNSENTIRSLLIGLRGTTLQVQSDSDSVNFIS